MPEQLSIVYIYLQLWLSSASRRVVADESSSDVLRSVHRWPMPVRRRNNWPVRLCGLYPRTMSGVQSSLAVILLVRGVIGRGGSLWVSSGQEMAVHGHAPAVHQNQLLRTAGSQLLQLRLQTLHHTAAASVSMSGSRWLDALLYSPVSDIASPVSCFSDATDFGALGLILSPFLVFHVLHRRNAVHTNHRSIKPSLFNYNCRPSS